MYEMPETERPGCRETLVITRAVFAVIIPAMLAIFFVAGMLTMAIVAYATHPALALLPIGALVAAVLLFARWERGRFGPPDV